MNNRVNVSLGKPIKECVLIPVHHEATPRCIYAPFMVNGECFRVTCVSFGTPHGAVFVDNIDDIDISSIGYALGNHVLFPKGASIVFIEIVDHKNIRSSLWQYGEGEIPFTNEAVAVAATVSIMLQKLSGNKVKVEMGGNTFYVEQNPNNAEVMLSYNK